MAGWRARYPSRKLKEALLKKISVRAVVEAAEVLASQGLHAPGHILDDPDTSIRVRREVGSLYSRSDTSDPKHVHFVRMLEAARSSLRSVLPAGAPTSTAPSSDNLCPAGVENSFVLKAARSSLRSVLPAGAPTSTAPSSENLRPAGVENSFAGLSVQEPRDIPESIPRVGRVTVGEVVRIQGLASKPELNGYFGTVECYMPETDAAGSRVRALATV